MQTAWTPQLALLLHLFAEATKGDHEIGRHHKDVAVDNDGPLVVGVALDVG